MAGSTVFGFNKGAMIRTAIPVEKLKYAQKNY
jgi:hypothetical protein